MHYIHCINRPYPTPIYDANLNIESLVDYLRKKSKFVDFWDDSIIKI